MRSLDDIGATIERQVDAVEQRFARTSFGSFALGALLALGVVAGGIATFIIVLALLVRFFS